MIRLLSDAITCHTCLRSAQTFGMTSALLSLGRVKLSHTISNNTTDHNGASHCEC